MYRPIVRMTQLIIGILFLGMIALTPVMAQTEASPVPEAGNNPVAAALTRDPKTLTITDLSEYNLSSRLTVYQDTQGNLTATDIRNRYLRGDQPRVIDHDLFAYPNPPQILWLVVPIYNQTNEGRWTLDFGDRLSGRTALLTSLGITDGLSGQRWFYLDLSPNLPNHALVRDRQVDRTITIPVPPKTVSLMLIRLQPDPNHPVIFPLRLIPGTGTEPSEPFWQKDQWLWILAAIMFGVGLFAAWTGDRKDILMLGLFGLSLPIGAICPLSLISLHWSDVMGEDHILLGLQLIFLLGVIWMVARTVALNWATVPSLLGLWIVQGGAIMLSVLWPGMIGSLAGLGFVGLAGLLTVLMVMRHDPRLAFLLLTMLAVFISAVIWQILSITMIVPPTPLGVNAIALSTVILAPLGVILCFSLPLALDLGQRRLQAAQRKRQDPDREKMAALKNAKESYDYNNLLKVIEHERKQLAAARTREMIRTEEMRKAKEQADEANRAKSAFLAVVSHEIRTPMTGIMGMVKLLHDTTMTKNQTEYVQTIKESGNAMMALLNDILDFEKIESGKMQLEQVDFDLHRLLQGIITLMNGHATTKGLRLELKMEFGLPQVVVGDSTRLRQVLLNLIGNAIKFTREGQITVRVNATSESDEKSNRLNHQIYFAVEDTGIGIPIEAQKNIFTPFSQADKSIARKYGGSGLGLAISQRLIEAMGSQINIKSREGEGTMFFFTLNMPQGEASRLEDQGTLPMAAQTDQAPATSAQIMRILVVEDNSITQKVLETMIGQMGHKLLTASSGEEALPYLQMGERFDLIITDIQMMGMSGLDFARAVRALPDFEARHIPIIALTGNIDQADIDECYAAGMNGHLAKPIEPDQLEKVLSQISNQMPGDLQAGSTDSGISGDTPSTTPLPSPPETRPTVTAPETAVEPARPVTPLAAGVRTTTIVTSALEFELLSTLRDSLGDAQLNELLKGLYVKTEEIILALQKQEKLDLAFTRARAHEMKGMCGNFGLVKLADAAKKIEQQAKAGQAEGIQDMIGQLTDLYQHARRAIDKWMAG